MPNLTSIAVETSKHYVALDSEGHVWRGQRVTKRGGPSVKWALVVGEFPRSGKPGRLTRAQQSVLQDELAP
jgi:hypothetical protein